jgi:porphobilinogen synthase
MKHRPRRLRQSAVIRNLVEETALDPKRWIYPLFILEDDAAKIAIAAMPGQYRLGLEPALHQIERALELGVHSFALFPVIADSKKDPQGTESKNPRGLLPRALREIKKRFPETCLISDVALDPYSSDGHDGLVRDGKILNDESLPLLTEMALVQSAAGADFVAPSDMMDGRVGVLRDELDRHGFTETGIIAYTAKYASAFYGPFREALDSAPKAGDKKTYQMNPANRREALREADLDQSEGADILMVKPALSYLDIIRDLSNAMTLPIAAYNVSGEYSMVKLAAAKGLFNERQATLEILTSIHRAGADMIFTYHAIEAAQWLQASKI